jgi:hypothetical protein
VLVFFSPWHLMVIVSPFRMRVCVSFLLSL